MRKIKKISSLFINIIALLVIGATPAFAHVIVSPNEAGIGSTREFSMSVPSEKNSSTVSIKLLIPQGLQSVTPNVKPGWTINVKEIGSGDNAQVSEIDWTGGNIPMGERDNFLFQAQVPSKETTLNWKAYQTYADGEEVDWVNTPGKNPEDDSAPPPYSQTKIINDLKDASGVTLAVNKQNNDVSLGQIEVVSFVALGLSALSLGLILRRR